MPDLLLGADEPLEHLVLGQILERRAESHGDSAFLEFRGATFTFGEVLDQSNRMARGLHAFGVAPHSHVAVMLPNCPDMVFVTFALARLGAVMVPVNTAYRGETLRHVLRSSGCSTLILEERYADRLVALAEDVPDMVRAVIRTDGKTNRDTDRNTDRYADGHTDGNSVQGEAAACVQELGVATVELPRLLEYGSVPPEHTAAAGDLLSIMYTSGSTGPAKGVLVPHALALACAQDVLRFVNVEGEKIYCPLPLHHAAGLWDGVFSALLCGGCIAVVERFSASAFWDDVRAFDAQLAISVFAMLPILLNQPPSHREKDHPLKVFYTGKSVLDRELRQRFGVRSVESYTSTEAGIPLASPFGEWRSGSCGKVNAERFEAAVVDEDDRVLPPGTEGELVLRPRQPHILLRGYYGNFEATARAFRNLWFHTGDRVRQDDEGNFYFVDRMADAIRRRGENISAFDIELAVNAHPDVRESAVIGVPSPLGEDDVKLVLVRAAESTIDHRDVLDHCRARLPPFMVPRYVEFVDALPRTSTDKVAKHLLRAAGERGITEWTWDSEGPESTSTSSTAPSGLLERE